MSTNREEVKAGGQRPRDQIGIGESLKTNVTVEIFTFCTHACNANGSLDINGTFDVLEVKEFPKQLQKFYIVLRLRLPKTNPFAQCELLFIDPEGKLLLKPTTVEVSGASANFVFANPNAKLTQAGIYYVVLRENGKVIASLPLFVNQIGQPKCTSTPYLN
jgi:hypothetical protein